MKTESEILKENTREQFVQQRFEELLQLIEAIQKANDVLIARSRRFYRYTTILLFLQIGAFVYSGVTGNLQGLSSFIAIFFWLTMFYSHMFINPKIEKNFGRIQGIFEALKVLGFVDTDPFEGGRKKKEVKESKVAKIWESLKQKARAKAYKHA